MKRKMVKKLICTVLTFTLVFCTVAMFPSAASAEPGDPSSFSLRIGSYSFTGRVSANTSKTQASATSSYGIKASVLRASVTLYYSYTKPGSMPPETGYGNAYGTYSNNNVTSVSASAIYNKSYPNYSALHADGEHYMYYSGTSSTQTTRINL
ncbi:hypothetical protein H6A12_01190 [Phocea massiliensis]|uniref:Uncharacterized protein n=1 Tax=Merdimmobilis hominis TaxID=2897707 RepID=A0A939BD92_9FIRM|nr:hypothetical protein [Merdimmobilis hominis]MBM6919782.1 hypothetical protein [Merdimmobilis hominis]